MRSLRYFRLWQVLGWLLVVAIIYLSLTPQPVDIPVRYGDKWSHLLAYGVLMGWFVQLYQNRNVLAVFALLFIVMGIGLEVLQGYTGRYFEYADMAANTLGVLFGLMLLLGSGQNLLLRWEQRFLS